MSSKTLIRLLCSMKNSNCQQNQFNFNSNIQSSLAFRYSRFLKHRFASICQISLQSANKSCSEIAQILTRQCNAIVALRIRRSVQILQFYNRLGYGINSFKTPFEGAKNYLTRNKRKPIGLILGGLMFDWEHNKITTTEIESAIEDLCIVESDPCEPLTCKELPAWQSIIDRDQLKVWRRPMEEDSGLYEYKVFGRYRDLPAEAFFNAQVDIDYRKSWDKLIIGLEVVDRDEDTKCEVIRWRMHFPVRHQHYDSCLMSHLHDYIYYYPMYAREYVYIRKQLVDEASGTMVLVSHSTEHPYCPRTNKYVRVDTYMSQMVIRSHSRMDENGFDYILTYTDNPKGNFPSMAYNWMASTGVPDFVDKMIVSAKNLNEIHLNNTSAKQKIKASCHMQSLEQDNKSNQIPM